MKRVIPSVLVVIFPYSILWHLCWVLGWGPIAFPKDWTIAEIYGLIILTWLIGLAATIWLTIVNASSKTDAITAAWSNMLIKLLQTPAYILLFIAGAMFSTIIFTWLITFTIIVTDVMTIFLTGINGIVAACKCRKAGLLKTSGAVWFSISQFIYCVDVVCAVILYLKVKRAMDNIEKDTFAAREDLPELGEPKDALNDNDFVRQRKDDDGEVV